MGGWRGMVRPPELRSVIEVERDRELLADGLVQCLPPKQPSSIAIQLMLPPSPPRWWEHELALQHEPDDSTGGWLPTTWRAGRARWQE